MCCRALLFKTYVHNRLQTQADDVATASKPARVKTPVATPARVKSPVVTASKPAHVKAPVATASKPARMKTLSGDDNSGETLLTALTSAGLAEFAEKMAAEGYEVLSDVLDVEFTDSDLEEMGMETVHIERFRNWIQGIALSGDDNSDETLLTALTRAGLAEFVEKLAAEGYEVLSDVLDVEFTDSELEEMGMEAVHIERFLYLIQGVKCLVPQASLRQGIR
jgi:hypothetical protein